MRIAFLHQPNDPYTVIRLKYFISQGHRVYSITFPKKNKQQSKIDGLINIELPELLINRIFLLKRIVYIWHIYKITKSIDLDILHIVDAKSMIMSVFSRSKKTIVQNQGSDVLKIPEIYPWLIIIYKLFYKYADAVIQDSKIAQDAGLKYGASEKNNKVIEIGVDFSVFNDKVNKGIARKKLGLTLEDRIVFSSRGMASIYNIDTIIKSIPKVKVKFPDVKYVFASNYGSFSQEMEKFINSKNLNDNIIYTGFLNHTEEMPYFYRDSDVVVSVPSSDSSPFSVYEAMATLTPVIVSDLPWLEGKFITEKHLITVLPKNENMLAEKIINVLKGEHTLDLESSYDIVHDKINMFKENKRLECLYKMILTGGGT